MRIHPSPLLVLVCSLLLIAATEGFRVATTTTTTDASLSSHVLQMSLSQEEERVSLRARVWNKAKQPIVGVWKNNYAATKRHRRSSLSLTNAFLDNNDGPRSKILLLKKSKPIALIATVLTTILAHPNASYAKVAATTKAVAVAASVAAGPKPCFKIIPAGMFFAAVTGASVIVGKAVLKGTRAGGGGGSSTSISSSTSSSSTGTIQEDAPKKEEEVTTASSVDEQSETVSLVNGKKWVNDALERRKESKETAAAAAADASSSESQMPAPQEKMEDNGDVAVATAVETATATAVETETKIVSNGHTAPPKLPAIISDTLLVEDDNDDAAVEDDDEAKKTGVRPQPLSPEEEAILQAKYAQIEDVGERCYQVLEDLGLLEDETEMESSSVGPPVMMIQSKPSTTTKDGHVVAPKVESASTITPDKSSSEKTSVWNRVVEAVNGSVNGSVGGAAEPKPVVVHQHKTTTTNNKPIIQQQQQQHQEEDEKKSRVPPLFVRKQPLPKWLASKLQAKYGKIDDLSEKCYRILDDLELLKDAYPK